MKRPAVFLDRDGTLMEDRDYVGNPEDVVLMPGAASAVRRLNDAGIAAVVITNQSGIARGYFDAPAYEAVRARLDRLLAAEGAHLDASYYCPHHPQFTGPCDCRKPGVRLYRQAIADLALDDSRTAFVGDRWRDVDPAAVFGGIGAILLQHPTAADELRSRESGAHIVPDVAAAVEVVLQAWAR